MTILIHDFIVNQAKWGPLISLFKASGGAIDVTLYTHISEVACKKIPTVILSTLKLKINQEIAYIQRRRQRWGLAKSLQGQAGSINMYAFLQLTGCYRRYSSHYSTKRWRIGCVISLCPWGKFSQPCIHLWLAFKVIEFAHELCVQWWPSCGTAKNYYNPLSVELLHFLASVMCLFLSGSRGGLVKTGQMRGGEEQTGLSSCKRFEVHISPLEVAWNFCQLPEVGRRRYLFNFSEITLYFWVWLPTYVFSVKST